MAMRYAIVHGSRGEGEVKAYLPSNYEVVGSIDPDPDRKYGQLVFIAGEDKLGWDFRYVKDRLGSGSMGVAELEEGDWRQEAWDCYVAAGGDPDGGDARHLNPGEAVRVVRELREEYEEEL